MPHGFDLGGIGPSEAIECGEGDVLVGSDGADDLGIGLCVKGVETGFGVLVGGECTVPIGGLRGFAALGRGDVEESGSDVDSSCGQSLGEEGGPKLEEVLLFHSVFLEDGDFLFFGFCGSSSTSSRDFVEGLMVEVWKVVALTLTQGWQRSTSGRCTVGTR